MHTYINAVLSAIYMYDMYVYIDIYIKWHPKTAFLFATHAVILTLPHFTCFNVILYFSVFPFLFTLSFPFHFHYQTYSRRRKVSSLSFLFSKALSKVLCVDSLRYLQERLALQHLLPAVPSRYAIVREDPEEVPSTRDRHDA